MMFCSVCYGIDFDGTDDLVDCGNDASLQITGDVAMSCWMKADAFPTGSGNTYLIGKGYDGTNEGYVLRYWDDSGTTNIEAGAYHSGTQYQVRWVVTFSTGEWHHIGGQYDGTNWEIIVDGVEVESLAKAGGAASTSDPVSIGCWTWNGSPHSRYFNGEITEVYVWDNDLTAEEWALLGKSRLKGVGLMIQTSNLKLYAPLDDQEQGTSADGDNCMDLSGNSNNGTGDDGANNTGLTWQDETVLSYPE